MTIHALAQLTIRDRARYDRYHSPFMDVLERHNGRVLVADERPRVEERLRSIVSPAPWCW